MNKKVASRTATLLRPAAGRRGVYWLELAGEEDAFAAYAAATAAAGVDLLAPGIASAGSLGSTDRKSVV